MDLESGPVLFIADGKRAKVLAPLFKRIRRSRTKLEAVAMYMTNAYKLAVEKYYRHPVAIVHDRFHVQKVINHELDELPCYAARYSRGYGVLRHISPECSFP